MRRLAVRIALLLPVATLACAELSTRDLDQVLGAVLGPGTPDAETVARGLREALEVGTDRAVGRTSSVDGFLGDALLRIGLPPQIDPVASALRGVGLGAPVDDLEVAMNRAAERASGDARGVFWQAIREMTIDDAVGILNGPPTAATDYFRAHTETTLVARFRPIVEASMESVGVYQIYDGVQTTYARLPLPKPAAPDLESWVTDHTTEGLFTVLGAEEKRIREDPAARSTELLRQVFGTR